MEFFSLMLFLLSADSVDEVMARVPLGLRSRVIQDARSLRDARENDTELLDFTFGTAEVADEKCERVMFEWLDRAGDDVARWLAGEL